MTEHQQSVFAASMVAYLMAEEDDSPEAADEALFVQLSPKELIIVSLGLMLVDTFQPTQMLCGTNTIELMNRIADLIEVQFPEVLENNDD